MPSIEEHEAEWIEKTGLSKADSVLIDKWVESRLPTWSALPADKASRYTKEKTRLPRTIHVFTAFGKICVQVLCKTKHRIQPVGKGYYKEGKIAVEWRTKTLWVQYVGIRHIDEIRQGLEAQDQLIGQPGIFPTACGRGFYKQKSGKRKFSFFGPLRDGSCRNAIPLLRTQIYSVAHQLLKILCVLEKANVIHMDIKKDNLLYRIDSNQKIHIELIDFDVALVEKESDLAEYRNSLENVEQTDFVDDRLDDIAEVSVIFTELDPDETFFSENLLEDLPNQSAQTSLAQFESEYATRLS